MWAFKDHDNQLDLQGRSGSSQFLETNRQAHPFSFLGWPIPTPQTQKQKGKESKNYSIFLFLEWPPLLPTNAIVRAKNVNFTGVAMIIIFMIISHGRS